MDYGDFGRYLSQQRELRGLSRDDVAKVTKIPPTLISALETGQYERLPERVFVLNYVRAYATVIGLAPEEAVLRFEEVAASQVAPTPEAMEKTRRKKALVKMIVVLAGAALVGYGLLALMGKPPPPGSQQAKPAPSRSR